MELPIEQAADTDIWKPHIEAQATSGLSGKAYCQQHDLNYNRFCYQKRKEQLGKLQSKAFIPVSVKGSHPPYSGLTVTLPNGISISGIDNQFPEASAALIRALL